MASGSDGKDEIAVITIANEYQFGLLIIIMNKIIGTHTHTHTHTGHSLTYIVLLSHIK